jgi:hypothetical protein
MLHDKLVVLIWLFVPNPKVSVLHRLVAAAEHVDPRLVPRLRERSIVKRVVVSY